MRAEVRADEKRRAQIHGEPLEFVRTAGVLFWGPHYMQDLITWDAYWMPLIFGHSHWLN